MLKNKQISKTKINSSLEDEINTVVQTATAICKNFYMSEGSQYSDVTHERFDCKIEELVYILVDISDKPSNFAKYFTQTILFEFEMKGFSIIKHFKDIIKDIDEEVLAKLLDLSFKEELDKYQMFSILFQLLRESEENEVLKSDSEVSSHRSSDSGPAFSLLSTISSKKEVIFRALLLSIYKSCSKVENIQLISKLFFIIFIPYVFEDTDCKNEMRMYLDEMEDSEDIEKMLVKAIDLEDKYKCDLDQIDDTNKKNNNSSKVSECKGMSTSIINELINLIGSNFIPLKLIIQFSLKVSLMVIPSELSYYRSDVLISEPSLDSRFSAIEQQMIARIYQSNSLKRIFQSFDEMSPKSLYSYMLDFSAYNFLASFLTLSVKLSFAGDEINERDECEKIVMKMWSVICQKHNVSTVYSFIVYTKFILAGKVQNSTASDNKSEHYQRSQEMVDKVSVRLQP